MDPPVSADLVVVKVPFAVKTRTGIKGVIVGTTLYLVPAESKRVRRLALELDLSPHELLLRGLTGYWPKVVSTLSRGIRPSRRVLGESRER
jgi:hypothetical protein